jgi:hypothetical protein
VCLTSLALVRLDLVLGRKIVRISDSQRCHELLLLCRARLAGGCRRVNDWRSFWGYRG